RAIDDLSAVLAGAPGSGWVRGVGYHEGVAGDLDRSRLDHLIAHRPARVQHRSGALWVLNSAAVDWLGPGAPADGRLWRQDGWLRERLARPAAPDLAPLGAHLAAMGITGVTDATPGDAAMLARATASIPQRVISLGDPADPDFPTGPRKIVLADHQL